MEEIVRLVSERTGLPEAQARTAVETVIGVLKDRVPPPFDKQIETLLRNPDSSPASSLVKGLGGLLGKR